MPMSKKHYIAIAEAIRLTTKYSTCDKDVTKLIVNDIIRQLVFIFKRDNPNFESEKFRKACSE